MRKELVGPLLAGRSKYPLYHLQKQRAPCWAAEFCFYTKRKELRQYISVAFPWLECDLFKPGWQLTISTEAKGFVYKRRRKWTTLILTDEGGTCFVLNDLQELCPPYIPTFDSHSSNLVHFLCQSHPTYPRDDRPSNEIDNWKYDIWSGRCRAWSDIMRTNCRSLLRAAPRFSPLSVFRVHSVKCDRRVRGPIGVAKWSLCAHKCDGKVQ